jgi:outer membrane protein assembly factor BamB
MPAEAPSRNKSSVVRLKSGATLFPIFCLAFAFNVFGADWPQFLGPNRSGTTTETNLAPVWPREGPPVVWQRKVGEGFSGPVVSGGRLILFHRLEGKEAVECLDAKSGKVLWKAEYPTQYRDDFGFDEGPRATPAIAGNAVITFGAEGMLHCWTLEKGDKRWSVDTKAAFNAGKGFFGVASSPLADGDAVILNIGGRNGTGIVAFDKATGKVLWKVTDDEASYSSPVAATVAGKRRLFVVTREALVALQAGNGNVDFRYPWRPPMHASVSAAVPLIIDDLIFISASYGTGATLLRYKEGAPEKIWSNDEALSCHYATPVHRDGFLYGFDGRADPGLQADSSLRCVELKTGKVRWKEDSVKVGTVTLAGGQLLILTEKGELIIGPANPDGFKPAARAQILPFVVRAHPALADGLFYARSKDKLVCVDLRKQK